MDLNSKHYQWKSLQIKKHPISLIFAVIVVVLSFKFQWYCIFLIPGQWVAIEINIDEPAGIGTMALFTASLSLGVVGLFILCYAVGYQ